MSLPNSGLVSEKVFAQLLDAVLSGRYAPGERLPTQRDLAADLGVTLSSLREALKRLEQMGLVDVRHGDATRVRDWRDHGGLDVVAHLLLRGGAVDPTVLRDVFEVRTFVLREMAGLAAARRDDDATARLRDLAGRLGEADQEDALAAAHMDFAFFTEVARAAGNVVFILVLNTIRDLYLAHLDRLTVTADPSLLAPAYGAIAAAIGDGHVERARTATHALAEAQRIAVEQAAGA